MTNPSLKPQFISIYGICKEYNTTENKIKYLFKKKGVKPIPKNVLKEMKYPYSLNKKWYDRTIVEEVFTSKIKIKKSTQLIILI
jgi:hypothetical protein